MHMIRRRSSKTRHHATAASRRGRLGQGIVEFALIIPVFLFFLLMAVDFGRLLFSYVELSNTAREAASYAAFNPTTLGPALTSVAQREANVQAQNGEHAIAVADPTCVDSAGTTILCNTALGGTGAGNRIKVNVSEQFSFFTPLINNFWGGGGLQVGTTATAAVVVFAPSGGTAGSTCTTVPPTPTFTWQSPDPVSKPLFISVNAGASSSPASPCQIVGYEWNFGGAASVATATPDDPFAEGITEDYEFLLPGTYTVTLQTENGAGLSAPFSTTISLGTTSCNLPVANFTLTPLINQTYYKNGPHPGSAFQFDGTSSAFMSDPACHPTWSWNLGDGSPLQTTSTISGYHYNTGGGWSGSQTVTVTLTATNDAGVSAPKTASITMDQDK